MAVEGANTEFVDMENQVYQGTVLGPSLWNVYFAPVGDKIKQNTFGYNLFADDLTSHATVSNNIDNEDCLFVLANLQDSIHRWGRKEQITFDRDKESCHIISKTCPHGDPFKLLGISFDMKLQMNICIRDTVVKSNYKLRIILRTQRFYNDRDLVNLYKAQILSFIEFRTSSIYHACPSTLAPLRFSSG